jgi:heparan-sulfate lyase
MASARRVTWFAVAVPLALAAASSSDAQPALVFGPVQLWRTGAGPPDTTRATFSCVGLDGEFTLKLVNGEDDGWQVQGSVDLNGQTVVPLFSEEQELIAESLNPEIQNELVVVLSGSAPGFVTVSVWVEGLSDESFFDLLDLERAGLEEVRDRVLAGDYPGAEAALLEYMQARELPYLPLGVVGDYQAALGVVDHRFDLGGQEVHFPHDIAWNQRPDTLGLQLWCELHKHTHLKELAEAYGDTSLSDELWAREWVSQCLDWTLDCYPADPRRDTPAQIGLLVGRRVTNWLSTHQRFVVLSPSSSVSPGDYVGFLKSLYQQADTLWARAEWDMTTNGGIIGAGALFQVSLMFPEFLAADLWRTDSQDSLAWAVENTFYPDGTYFEESLHYHRVAHTALMVALSLATIHGYVLSANILAGVEREVEALLYVVKPDLNLPQIGDGDNLWSGETFLDAWEAFPHRTDFLYAGTMGLSGDPPPRTARAFPYGGYYVMRSDWDYRTVWVGPKPEQVSDASYLLLTVDRAVPGSHFHFDPLSIEAHAYGQTVVKDPGQYGYDDQYWRDYFQATLQHNTVAIDDRDAWHYPDSTGKEWFAGPSFTSVVASHFNYYWLGAVHTRGVLFLRPWCWIVSDVLTLFPGPAPMPHDFFQSWHFMPGVEPVVEEASGTATAGHLMLLQARGAELDAIVEDSYVCLSGGELEQAKALRYRTHGTVPVAFHTALIPLPDPAEPPSVSVEHVPAYEGGTELGTWQAAGMRLAKEDTVVLYAANHDSALQVRMFGDISTNGLAACVVRTGGGEITSLFLCRGDQLWTGDTLLASTGETAAVEWSDTVVVIEGLSNLTSGFRVWAPTASRVRVGGRCVQFHREGPYVVGVGRERCSPREPAAWRLVVPSPSRGEIDLSLIPSWTRLRVHDLAGRLRFSGPALARRVAISPGLYVVTAEGSHTKVLVVR